MKWIHFLIINLLLVLSSTLYSGEKNKLHANDSVTQKLDQQWKEIQNAGEERVSRELFRFALEALRNGTHKKQIAQAFAYAEKMQDRDPKSDTYGNFKWYWKQEAPHDLNAVEFCMSTGILCWKNHKNQLNTEARERLRRLIHYSIEGIKRHNVNPGYTNIFLKKTWNCIAIGESMGRPEFAKKGYNMLDRWIKFTLDNGIREFSSPTYYWVDMTNVNRIMHYASREEERRKAATIMELFWMDVASNWFAPGNRLAGAHSRDYNFIKGGGQDERFYQYTAGAWNNTIKVPPTLPKPAEHNHYWNGALELRDVVHSTPRLVLRRWGDDPRERAVNYITDSYSIGSSSAAYGFIDKTLVVNLGEPKTRAINLVLEGQNDPYSKHPVTMPSGHHKSLHFNSFLTSVQRRSEVLYLALPRPTKWYLNRMPPVECLKSHITLPDKGKVWIGEEPIHISGQPAEFEVHNNAPVLFRYGDVVVAIRFVLALDVNGNQAPIKLVRDEEGIQYNVMRLTCIHSPEPSGKKRGVIGLWIKCKEVSNEQEFEDLRQTFSQPVKVEKNNGRVRLEVNKSVKPLGLVVNIDKQERIHTIGKHDAFKNAVLKVNGRDYGRLILNRLLDAQ